MHCFPKGLLTPNGRAAGGSHRKTGLAGSNFRFLFPPIKQWLFASECAFRARRAAQPYIQRGHMKVIGRRST